MKRAKIDTDAQICADPKLLWMTKYSVVSGDDRWSMSLLVFDSNGVLRRHAHAVDPSHALQVVEEMIKMIEDDNE